MLDAILAHKREEVAGRRAALSLESLLSRCIPSRRSLSAALAVARPGFLLELKFASPSAGTIRRDHDLEPILASYAAHADAVSVLTDERFFGGSLARLAQVRERLAQPLLCKDFILEPYQVAEARAHGADAILLILAAVDDATWRACAALAAKLGMEVLTEVHDAAEAERAVALDARVIGVNHRDLRTLRIDLATSARVAPLIPADRLVIAESGITGHAEVVRLRPHVDAVLVGSALMGAADLDAAVRELVYGRTKVCGLTRPEDALAARAAGATHAGLMFAGESPRRVAESQAAAVRRAAELNWVGVFANQSPEWIAGIANQLDLAAVQLHGEEPPELVEQVRARVPSGCAVWKAIRVTDRIPPRQETRSDRLLLDGWSPGARGGSGSSFDWSLLERYADRSEVILAGGLRAENVAEAAALGTYALDVSSGVESAPGKKSAERLQRFFRERRKLAGRGGTQP